MNLLFLGDSLIDYGDWPRRLAGYRVISSGIPGETSMELLRRLPGVATSSPPDAVILMTGTNDLLGNSHGFEHAIGRIVAELRRLFPNAAIVLTGLPPFRLPGLSQAICSLNRVLDRTATRTGCRFCDLNRAFAATTENLFSIDGVHLDEAGYRSWAGEVQAILEQLAFASDRLTITEVISTSSKGTTP